MTTPTYALLTPTLSLGGAERNFISMAKYVPGCLGIVLRLPEYDPRLHQEATRFTRVLRNAQADWQKCRGDLEHLNPDVVITWGCTNFREIVAGLPCKKVFLSQVSPELPGVVDWIKPQLPGCTHYVAVSKGAAECFHLADPNGTTPCYIIPNMVDPIHCLPRQGRKATREALQLPEGTKLILWLGRFSEQKQPKLAPRVLDYLPPEYKLLMVGPKNEYMQEVKNGAQPPYLNGRLAFLPGVHRVGDLLAAADVLLVCSTAEGLPLTVIESFFVGLPVVMPRLKCIEDLRVPGGGCFASICAKGTPSCYANTIEGIEGRPRSTIGFAQDNFSCTVVGQRWETFLKEITS